FRKTCRLDCLFVAEHDHGVAAPAQTKRRSGERPARPAKPRPTQQQRSAATQRRLLDATGECLVEYGWSGITTTLIAQRAGVSRGAQLHHCPTKAELVLAAVTHLAERRAEEIRTEASTLKAQSLAERVDRVVDLLAA